MLGASLLSCKLYTAHGRVMVKTGQKSITKIPIPLEYKYKRLVVIDRTDCENEPFRMDNSEPTKLKITSETFKFLKKEINERDFYTFEEDVLKMSSVCSNQPFPAPLSINKVKEYTAGENLLLTIEKIDYFESDNFREDVESTYDKNNVLLSRRNVIIGRKLFSAKASIKLYNHGGELMDSLLLTDDYAYEVKGTNQINAQRLMNQGRDLAVENIGKKIGFKIADAVSPYEIEILRYYFANTRYNEKFNIAEDIISEDGDWEAASTLWREVAESEGKADDRAKAYFNLGVFHEKNGRFEEAITSLEKSAALNNEVGGEYLRDLRKRYR